MTLLDLTIVNIAVPSIIKGLHASLDQMLWVLNAYSLVYAVLLLTSGRLGDVVGPRNLFATGVAIFTAASLASGLAQTPVELILARGAQGLAAALIAPQGLPIMLSLFPADRRAGVFAIYGSVAGLAVVAGPTLGGFLVTRFGWPSIFLVNIPIGILVFALAFLLVPDLRPGRSHRFDLLGVALVTLGLLGLVFGLIEGQRYNWGQITGPISIPLVIGGGVAVLALFGLQQALRQGREPLVPFQIFRDRNFTLMALVLAAIGFAILGVYLPLTIYLQSVLGLSAVQAGLTIAPQPIAMLFSSGVAAPLSQKVNGKYLLIPGLVLFAAGAAYIGWVAEPGLNRWELLPGLIVSGIGMGWVWTPVFSLATRDLKPELGGLASGLANTVQELGTVFASAAAGALLQSRLAASLVHASFPHAFATAMRETLPLPIATLLAAAALTFWVRSRPLQVEEAQRHAA